MTHERPADTRSLFLRLLPKMAERGSERRSDGHEEYITQTVGVVLQEDHGLVRRLLREWCSLDPAAASPVRVLTERPYPAPAGFQSAVCVDLVIETDEALVFIENKVGASLNRYLATDGTARTQVDIYHAALLAARGKKDGHLLVLCRDPQQEHKLACYRGYRYWSELFDLIDGWRRDPSHPGGHAAWLQDQILAFFSEVDLDPPVALSRGPGFREAHARRLLAEAARRVQGLGNPRMPTWLLYEWQGATWTVGFRGDQISIFEAGSGARTIDLPDAFWAGDVETQIAFLAALLLRVAGLPHAETARTPLEDALGQFAPANRELARQLKEILVGRWDCTPTTGQISRAVAEIGFRSPDGLAVRLGPYADNRLILVGGSRTAELREAVASLLGCPLPEPQAAMQVNVPLRLLAPAVLNPLIELFERHARDAPR